jgi:MarR family transcriptional regulator, organic hydroperoxide resistance regulator
MDYQDLKVKKAIEVLQSFWAITRTTTKFTQQNAESLGLTLQQMSINNLLYSTPGVTLKEITEKLGLSKSSVSVAVDGLVQAGYVIRQTSSEDRREINLSLTPEGKELSKKSTQNAYSYRAMVLALEEMKETDVEQLLTLNKQLVSYLQKVEF